VTVRVPPLRDRLEDLELLVPAILDGLDARGSAHLFTPEVFAEMRRYDWPGNVRELRNFVERTVILRDSHREEPALGASPSPADRDRERPRLPGSDRDVLPEIDLERSFRDGKDSLIVDYERRYLHALLEWANGNVTKAARKAKIDRMSLYRLMQRHDVRQPMNGNGSKD
jgi:DNA-binding NtrC family response regulator